MEYRDGGFQALVLEVAIKLGQVLRHHHAFEDNGGGGQARHVEHRVRRLHGFLGEPPGHIQLAVERGLVHVRRTAIHKHLLDVGQGLQGLGAASLRIHRDHAPAGDLQLLALQLGLESRPRDAGQRRIRIKENEPGGELLGQLDAGLGRHGAQKPLGAFQQQAATVAGFPVAGDRPTVREAVERRNSRTDQPMARLVIEVGNQAKPAAIAFVGVFIESLGGSAHLCGLEFSHQARLFHRHT